MSRFGIEDNTTEFKVELNDKLEREVVAFLNSEKGGDIFIGVDDDGHAVGVADPDALMLTITDRIKNNIQPSCLGLFDVFPEEHDGKTVIHILISRGTEKPYYLRKFGQSPAGCFLRVGSGVQQMTVGMIDQLYAGRVRNSLRNTPAPAGRNLSFQQLKIYYQEKGFEVNKAFLNNLDLYVSENQFNYVAHLLADENSVSIKVAKYAGTDKCELIENEEYGFCSLVKATHRVLDKLNIENKTMTRITGAAEREQHRLVDERALREALINAIVHNDYSSEIPPVVEIYTDRIAITSYGGLVHGLSREEFLAGRSMPRNRELMRVFRDLDLVEQLGSGVHRILSAYDSSVFHISDHFFEISFPVSDQRKIYEETPQVTQQVKGMEGSVLEQLLEKNKLLAPQVTPQVVKQVRMILKAATEGNSREVLQEATGMRDREHFRKTYLEPLLSAGWLERTIPDKPRSSKQKYRLTEKGRTILEAQ